MKQMSNENELTQYRSDSYSIVNTSSEAQVLLSSTYQSCSCSNLLKCQNWEDLFINQATRYLGFVTRCWLLGPANLVVLRRHDNEEAHPVQEGLREDQNEVSRFQPGQRHEWLWVGPQTGPEEGVQEKSGLGV